MSNKPRPFQTRFSQAFSRKMALINDGITTGQPLSVQERTLIAVVHPASGKTLMIIDAAGEAVSTSDVDYVVFVTPRVNLCGQCELDTESYLLSKGSQTKLRSICHVENAPPLLRAKGGQSGYTTTYQALVADPALHLHFFEQHTGRILLIGDEAHMLGDTSTGSDGTQSAKVFLSLAEHAKAIILMTGTPYRADRGKLILARYTDPSLDPEGKEFIQADVEASYLEGVQEGYLRPLSAELFDGNVTLRDLTTNTATNVTVSDYDKGMREVLIREAFYQLFIGLTIQKVREQQAHYKPYCGLVCAVDQKHARNIVSYIKRQHPTVNVLLAISDDNDGQSNLEKFKRGGYDLLVTCAMAHIGYSYQPINVVCALTSIREPSWLRQLIARGLRVITTGNPAVDASQFVHVIAPDDERMRIFIETMRNESNEGLQQRQQRDDTLPMNAPLQAAPLIVVEDAQPTTKRVVGMNAEFDVSQDEIPHLVQVQQAANVGHMPLTVIKSILAHNAALVTASQSASSNTVSKDTNSTNPRPMILRERLSALKRLKRKLQVRADWLLGAAIGVSNWDETNKHIIKFVGHSPKTEEELITVIDFLRQRWLPYCKQVYKKRTGGRADAAD